MDLMSHNHGRDKDVPPFVVIQSGDKPLNIYVLQNTRTKKVVEVEAVSPLLAANRIGWRPRHTRLIEKIDAKDRQKELEGNTRR